MRSWMFVCKTWTDWMMEKRSIYILVVGKVTRFIKHVKQRVNQKKIWSVWKEGSPLSTQILYQNCAKKVHEFDTIRS